MSFRLQQSFILVLLIFFEIVKQVYSIKGPTVIKGYIGEDAVFMWNTTNQTRIFSASWGIRKGNIAYPQFIYVNGNAGKVNVNSDLDETIQSRLAFIGDLTKGRAWFVLRNLTVNDTNEYIARISDNEEGDEPYPVRLEVTPKNETASVYKTTIRPTITSSVYKTTIRPIITIGYKLTLEGTFNITKENEPSDIRQYIMNETTAVFSASPIFHNVTDVTVRVINLLSAIFIINLTLWFKNDVGESNVKKFMAILQDRINNTSHFSWYIKKGHPKPPADPPADESKGLSEVQIAVIVIGAISGVIITAGIIYIVYKKRFQFKKPQDNPQAEGDTKLNNPDNPQAKGDTEKDEKPFSCKSIAKKIIQDKNKHGKALRIPFAE